MKDDLCLAWFRQHLVDLLPRWLGAVTDKGFFRPGFDRRWNRAGEGRGTLVSQSRLLYSFSVGHELTGESKYLDAVETGARFLVEHFRDHENGGWFWSCAEDGSVVDEKKDSYGHAFVIFGLSHAARATGDERLKRAALETWDVLKSRFRDEHGGFARGMSRDFSRADELKSQNPVMHLFEALLALGDLEGARHVHEEARKVAAFVLGRLAREGDGVLPEAYSNDWKELPADRGGRIDVGHQFEWSFLLSSAVERGLPEEFLAQAERLLDNGLRLGFDAEEGGVFSPASPEGKLVRAKKGWWEQCEAARAMMHFLVLRGRGGLREPFTRTVEFFKRHFVDEEYGGWYSAPPASLGKGSVWKLDYHVVGMCMEAMRLEKRA